MKRNRPFQIGLAGRLATAYHLVVACKERMKRYLLPAILVVAACTLTAAIERSMGRLILGPDGRFGWWEGNIWSSGQSQRFADPYSLSMQ
jgi:hypothetical protein